MASQLTGGTTGRPEVVSQPLPHRENVFFGDEALVPVQLAAGAVEEDLSGNDVHAVRRPASGFFQTSMNTTSSAPA